MVLGEAKIGMFTLKICQKNLKKINSAEERLKENSNKNERSRVSSSFSII